MNKNEMISAVAEKSGLTKVQTTAVVTALVDTITEQLINSDEFRLFGFGTFKTKRRPARQGRNPRSGESIQIKESASVTFKAGRELKSSVLTGTAATTTSAE